VRGGERVASTRLPFGPPLLRGTEPRPLLRRLELVGGLDAKAPNSGSVEKICVIWEARKVAAGRKNTDRKGIALHGKDVNVSSTPSSDFRKKRWDSLRQPKTTGKRHRPEKDFDRRGQELLLHRRDLEDLTVLPDAGKK